MSEGLNRQLLRMSLLLQLEGRARRAETLEELAFVIVNETMGLVQYAQAVLWLPDGGAGRFAAVSGVAMPDQDGPFLQWLRRAAGHLRLDPAGAPRPVTAANLPAELAAGWGEWLAAVLLVLPLPGARGAPGGVLLLARPDAPSEQERPLLDELAGAYGHALAGFQGRGGGWTGRLRARPGRAALVAAAGLALLVAFPVRQTALAPAEVVAREPTLVRAPVEGVVERILVRPNETVAEGQPLVALDPTRLRSRIEVACKALVVAEAEYRQAAQQAFADARANASLAALKGRLDQQAAELAYLETLEQRLTVTAPHAGVALFDDAGDWAGRPVALGERIMLLADPAKVELEAWVPVPDAVDLAPGAPVSLFLNTMPGRPVGAAVTQVGYRAQATPQGVLAYRVKAALEEGAEPPRVGLRGTAKLYGDRAALGVFLLRRPLGVLRQWLGA